MNKVNEEVLPTSLNEVEVPFYNVSLLMNKRECVGLLSYLNKKVNKMKHSHQLSSHFGSEIFV